ncbi:TPA: DUF2057 family protein [Aeromonas hydrophila]|uniref:DUF2057 family protein n=1 Tax=Aeromonas TaxID=642 RepID=UPI000909AA8E|nr:MULTISPECIES: DUF2057 family protein [Aeromonas]HEB4994974.1 DUF2057 family protein [Aeromonas hydrophila subsp. hydrophila]APJ13733.1 DUF2057 domain-containing protein [Aeromonas hydrophila]BBT08492.1 DUF2057 domain-containing protein [Aeromonas hydrophila]HEB5046643.1 DUF2057 family protein [Aeromonas hydrophila subsp. hydrophila]HEB5076212.1 DUF2057 family protein [Aeromonas hydrophila subsp. hydrophila]
MIRLPLLTTLLLLLALPTQAARLELADNLTLLASSRGKASPFERALTLPAGETRLLVRFDSPLDPGSTNESQGRVRSAPLLLTLTLPASGTLRLITPPLPTPQAIRRFAASPALQLATADGTRPLLTTALPRSQDSLLADYQALLARYDGSASATALPAVTPVLPEVTPSAVPVDPELQRRYLAADEAQRKAFLRWALAL